METKIKVLIADSNNDYTKLVANRFQDELDMELVGSTTDGLEVLRLTEELRPDVIVLDSLLENLAGLDVLLHLLKMDRKVSCIMVSAIYQDDMISEAFSLGASYFLRKPFGIQTLMEKIRHVAKRTNAVLLSDLGHIELDVTNILRELASPAHMKGHRPLRYGIALVVQDVKLLNAVTGKLYPLIAEKFDLSSAQVERCIRTVIETIWNQRDPEVFQKFFGYTVTNRKGKPTNSEFIAMIADQLSLQRKYGDGRPKHIYDCRSCGFVAWKGE